MKKHHRILLRLSALIGIEPVVAARSSSSQLDVVTSLLNWHTF
jgi:hypothetical protein